MTFSQIPYHRADLAAWKAQVEDQTKRFKEAYRVVNKVGTRQDIEAMRKIKKELKNKGFGCILKGIYLK